MESQRDMIGRVLAGRFRLTAQLGSGGMGSVWAAHDLTLDAGVAIKLLDPTLAEDEDMRRRFDHEAKAAAALRSPNVVQILDHGVDDGLPFIAMERLEGESLAERLAREGALSPEDTARVFVDVARAVRRAHEAGIIHRDLKPDNIFLVRDDDHQVAKVLDFGIAKATSPSGAQGQGTRAGSVMGTPAYMSPEHLRGAKVDARADLWSLGVIAFECLCGRVPFPSDVPAELVLEICSHPLPVPSTIARVPPGFDAWFARAVQRDPADRFPSAKEMAEALRAALAPGSPAATVTTGDRGGDRAFTTGGDRPEDRARASRLALALAAASLAIAAVVFAVRRSDRAPPASAIPVTTQSAASPPPPAEGSPSAPVVPVVTPAAEAAEPPPREAPGEAEPSRKAAPGEAEPSRKAAPGEAEPSRKAAPTAAPRTPPRKAPAPGPRKKDDRIGF